MFSLVLRSLAAILLLLSLLLAIVALVFSVQKLYTNTTFDISAQTEVLSGVVAQSTSIEVLGARICFDRLNPIQARNGGGGICPRFGKELRDLPPSITVSFAEGTHIRLQRSGTGQLTIDLRHEAGESYGAVDRTVLTAEDRAIMDHAVLVMPEDVLASREDALSISLILRDAMIGEAARLNAPGQGLLLQSANVVILGQRVFAGPPFNFFTSTERLVFRTEEIHIGTGNQISVPEEVRESETVFSGIAIVGSEPGFHLAVQVEAQRLEVTRFNTQGYHLAATFLDRLGGDPIAQLLWELIGLFAGSGLAIFLLRSLAREG